MMITASEITTHVKSILKYLHKNAWHIVFIIAGSYIVYDQFIDPLLHKLRTQQSYKSATNPDRIAVLSPDMKRVRLQQQELAAQRAIEAEEERKQKAKEAKERKRVKTPEEERWEKLGGEGSKLGESSGSATDKGDSAGLRRRR